MKIFRITGLVRVFNISDSVLSAIEAISAPILQMDTTPSLLADNEEFGGHWFSGRIYTSETTAGVVVEKSLLRLLEALGMEVVYEFPVQNGSWFREFLVRMKDSTARPTRDELLIMTQRAIEQQVLGKPQAQIDLVQSQAVAGLLVALEKTPKAAIQVGSLLIVKVQDSTVVRNLTQIELAYWQRHPDLFRDPEGALRELQRAADHDSTAGESQAEEAI
jgi:hypothetical protein